MNAPPEERRTSDLSAVEIAKLEGRMDKGFAELNGRLDTMISEARAASEKQQTAAALQQKQLDDHEERIRKQGDELADVKATADKAVTPGKLWAVAVALGMLVIGAAGVVVNAFQ